MVDYFIHPNRAKQNCEGPFYGVDIGSDCGCGIPENIAPELIKLGAKAEGYQSYFFKQPSQGIEIEKAIEAVNACPIHDLRYGGKNRAILQRIEPLQSDYCISFFGKLKLKK